MLYDRRARHRGAPRGGADEPVHAQGLLEALGHRPRSGRRVRRGPSRVRERREGRLHAQDDPARRGHRRRLGRGHRGQVRAPRGPGHRGGHARAEPRVHLLSVQQPGAERAPDDGEHHAQVRRPRPARRQDHPRQRLRHRGRRQARARRRRLPRVRPAHRVPGGRLPVGSGRGARPEPGQGAPRLEGGAADRRAGQADRGHVRRRRLRAHRAPRRVPVPARSLRAHLPGGLVPQDQQAARQDHRARRQPERRLEDRLSSARRGRPTPISTTARPARSSPSTRARARCGPSSTR